MKTKRKRRLKGTRTKSTSHIKPSKTEDFLERIKENTMVEYLTQCRILNPAAQLMTSLNQPRREGSFVRLAHAREEFTAPVITKGKSVLKKTRAGKKKA